MKMISEKTLAPGPYDGHEFLPQGDPLVDQDHSLMLPERDGSLQILATEELIRLRTSFLHNGQYQSFIDTIPSESLYPLEYITNKDGAGDASSFPPLLTSEEEKLLFSRLCSYRFQVVQALFSSVTEAELKEELASYFNGRDESEHEYKYKSASEVIYERTGSAQLCELYALWKETICSNTKQKERSDEINTFMRNNVSCTAVVTAMAEKVSRSRSDNELKSTCDTLIAVRQVVFLANVRLAWSVAWNFVRSYNLRDPDEIKSAAEYYLDRGIEKYDLSRDYKLSTYLYNWITVGVKEHLRFVRRVVKVPYELSCQLGELDRAEKRAVADFEKEFGVSNLGRAVLCEVLTPEIASAMAIDVQTVDKLRRHRIQGEIGIDYKDEGSSGPLKDFLCANNIDPWLNAAEQEANAILHRELKKLGPQERELVTELFGLNDSPPQSLLNISRTSGIQKRKLAHIRKLTLASLNYSLGQYPGLHSELSRDELVQEQDDYDHCPI